MTAFIGLIGRKWLKNLRNLINDNSGSFSNESIGNPTDISTNGENPTKFDFKDAKKIYDNLELLDTQ